MGYIFNLPDVGEGMAEGEIVAWLVSVGDHVEEGQAILELQNDKLTQEILSPYSGTVTTIKVEVGEVAQVGDPLIEFDGKMVEPSPRAILPTLQPENIKDAKSLVSEASVKNEKTMQPISNQTTTNGILAMPSVRRFAYKNNIDITTVDGTGKHNHITMDDVKATINQEEVVLQEVEVDKITTDKQSIPTENIEKMSGVRKAIVKSMITAKEKIPHVTLMDEVEITKLVAHRSQFKKMAQEQDIKLTYLPYIIKALIRTAQKYPILNSSVDTINETIIYHTSFNVGIATDTPKGLIVPNIKNANHYSILSLAKQVQELALAAKESKLKGADISNGTITITNIGSMGGSWFTPIINYPEVAILGVGRIQKQPIVDKNDEIVVGNVLKLSLSFDHRIIDGAIAQSAMNELKRLLSNPDILLMEV